MVSERRLAQRYTSVNPADCQPITSDQHPMPRVVGRTLDLSVSGALLETHTRIAPHHRLIILLGLADAFVELDAKPVHGRRKADGRFVTGIRFFNLDKHTSMVIHRYLRDA